MIHALVDQAKNTKTVVVNNKNYKRLREIKELAKPQKIQECPHKLKIVDNFYKIL